MGWTQPITEIEKKFGNENKFKTLELLILPQGDTPKAVSVSVTDPDNKSASLGVYSHKVNEVSLAKAPEPLVVQRMLL